LGQTLTLRRPFIGPIPSCQPMSLLIGDRCW
jgi:hypothetical protein